MSDSVANLTVKVNTKSVADAIKALDALASKAGTVEKSVGNIGAAAKKASGGDGLKQLESHTTKSAGALAKLEARLEKGAREHEKITRLVNQHALSERNRVDTLGRVNRAFTEYNRVIGNSASSTLQIDRATRQYNNTVRQLREGVDSVVKLQNQKTKALIDSEKQTAKNIALDAAAAKQQASNFASIERALQQAQTRVSGITGRAGRQLSTSGATSISREADAALASYTRNLRTYSVGSVESIRATADFNREMQRLSGEIARVGGLLPNISRGARTVSAAFGAANASVGGFSRAIFNTSAALSALTGTLALREITQSIMEFERFTNTLRTVSNSSVEFSRNLDFLFNEANRIGFAVGQVGNSFARLSLAMQSSGFNANESREAFTSLAEASRNFGLSSADTMGVIRALEQSMSKGKFMAEEVRLQMGDRLPVAMAALERAVTKVDGKQSDLNKRFEEGTLDTRRYALEFVRQINALSGGTEALSRTSNSIAAAFGRLNTEFVLTTKAFSEGGFSNAVIILTQNFIALLQTLREVGAISAAGAALEALAKQTTLLTTAVVGLTAALSASLIGWIARTVLALTPLGRAISLIAAGLTFLAGFVNNISSTQRFVNSITTATNNLTVAHREGMAVLEGFTGAIQNNNETLGASASALDKRVNFLRQIGVSEIELTRIVAEEEGKRLEIKMKAAQAELAVLQQTYATIREREIGFSNAISNSLTAVYQNNAENVKRGYAQISQAQLEAQKNFAGTWDRIRGEVVSGTKTAQDAYKEFSKAAAEAGLSADETVRGLLLSLLKIAEGEKPLQTQIKLVEALENAFNALLLAAQNPVAFRVNIQTEFSGEDPGLMRAAGVRTDFSKYLSRQETQLKKAGEIVLQEAYKRTTGDVKAVVDAEKFLKQTRAEAAAGNVGAKKILDDYTAATTKSAQKTTEAGQSISKYTDTLKAEIAAQDGITQAYRQSTLAGEEAEIQLKAKTEAIRLANGDQKKYADLLKQLPPLLQQQAQGERDKEAAKATTKQREDEIAFLELEKKLIGESVLVREQELAALQARQRLAGARPEIIADAENFARKTAQLRQGNQQLENSYQELGRIGERAFEQVGDAITEAFSKGELRALRFGDIVRGVMSSILQSIFRLAVLNPILNQIFTDTVRPTLSAGLSALGGGGGGAAGGGGGLGGLLGIGSTLRSGFSALTSGGLMAGAGGMAGYGAGLGGVMFGTPAIPFGMAGAGGATMGGGAAATTGLLGSGGSFSLASLGSTLGLAGAGFGLGSMVGGMVAGGSPNRQTNSMIGSGIGTAVGLALMPVLGPLGPILGGLIGGGGGGLIGPGRSSQGFGYNLQAQGGRLAPIDYRYFNEQGAPQFQEAEAGIAALNAFLEQRGLTVSGSRAVGGNRFGMGNLGYGEAASFSEAIGSLQFAATANEELNKALSARTFAGVGKLQEFVEGFIGLQDVIKGLTADPVPEFTQQMNALIDSFADATAKARDYGIAEEELIIARDKQIAKLEEQRSLTIRDTALGLEVRRLMAEGMEQEAQRIELAFNTQKEIEAFSASLDALGITAAEKSRLLVELERTQAAERASILRRQNQDIFNFLDSLRVETSAGTSPISRLTAAQEIFDRDLASAQSGDQGALSRITESAGNLLRTGEEYYASSAGYQNIRGNVVSSLEALATRTPSMDLMDISGVGALSDLTSMRQEASLNEIAQYNKQFDDKLAELLPIATAIQEAVEKSTEVQVAVAQQEWFSTGGGEAGGFAMGGVFRNGRVTAFANGGIPDLVNNPTMAPMALFGEAGPEAIMPLRRLPNGRLGVETSGGGDGAVVAELRAVRGAIESLEQTIVESESGGQMVEAFSELRVQIGGLKEELRTNRLRAQ